MSFLEKKRWDLSSLRRNRKEDVPLPLRRPLMRSLSERERPVALQRRLSIDATLIGGSLTECEGIYQIFIFCQAGINDRNV